MWSSRGSFPIQQLPDCKLPACVETPSFLRQQSDSAERDHLCLDVDDFNYLSSLDYTLLPTLSCEDAQALLPWVLHRWQPRREHFPSEDERSRAFTHALNSVIEDDETISAFTQVEYFFPGTDNGQLFAVPLLPMHFLRVLVERHGSRFPGLASELRPPSAAMQQPRHVCVPVHCCARRLLHRHAREELIRALDHNGTIVASAAADNVVALSFFHPLPSALVSIPHPKPVRCLKLWEGGVFVNRMGSPSGKVALNAPPSDDIKGEGESASESWRLSLGNQERAALYVFTGDDATTVRLWRVDVLQKQYALLHIFVASPNRAGVHSSLSMVDREDVSKDTTKRETGSPIYCLALDGECRLLAGTESGFYAWPIDKLSWKPLCDAEDCATAEGKEEAKPEVATAHPLCWCETTCTPLAPFLLSEQQRGVPFAAAKAGVHGEEVPSADVSSNDYTRALQVVRSRASRLVNHHVWLREANYMERYLPANDQPPKGRLSGPHKRADSVTCCNRVRLSKWKPKLGNNVAGGAAVGVVCNEVALQPERETKASIEPLRSLLDQSVVTVRFNEGGGLSNDLCVPLCCVEPVTYPLCFIKTPCIGCFALLVLQEGNRIVSSGSDGKCIVWVWGPEAEMYVPILVTDNKGPQYHLGRHLCRLREPDVFVTSGFDDSLVKEWHIYDEPEPLLRCERRFTLEKGRTFELEGSSPYPRTPNAQESGDETNDSRQRSEKGVFCEGISCAVSFEPFVALFVVGIFESTIRSFSLVEVSSCEVPPGYIYSGYRTVKLPELVNEN